MHKNLIRILKEKNVTNKSLALLIDVSEKTVGWKLQGKTEFTIREAMKIHEAFAPEYRMEYVFESFEK